LVRQVYSLFIMPTCEWDDLEKRAQVLGKSGKNRHELISNGLDSVGPLIAWLESKQPLRRLEVKR
jgi:hypothetical protein